MDTRNKGFNTKLVHAGIREDAHGSVVTPIYQTSTFALGEEQYRALPYCSSLFPPCSAPATTW